MSWKVAPSLVRLRSELNARYPKRDKTSDGSIGNAAHAVTKSDHNVNSRGLVDALDIDKDGINALWVVAQLKKHPAVNYVIFNRVIYSRAYGFRARKYTGANAHTEHIHVSIMQTTAAEQSIKAWFTTTAAPAKPSPTYPKLTKTLRRGMSGGQVDDLQKRLKARGWRITVDNDYGPATEKVVRAYQKDKRLIQDGVCGPVTWKSVWTSKVT